ncbi:MAG: LamG domain-containing protein [Verrucomicrobia bacterium]|nr:LamG domain-containing protein [Verrucomicrobiota bacterium]
MKHPIILPLLLGASLDTGHADIIAHYNMEQTGSPLVDKVGGQQAVATGSGDAYGLPGPTGFYNAVDRTADGSWQLSAADSAELRSLSNNITVAAWINLEPGRHGKSSNYDQIIGDDSAWNGNGWNFGVVSGPSLLKFTKNGVADIYSPAITVVPGTWYHVAVTVANTGCTFYLNGTELGPAAGNTDNMITTGSDPYAIGRSNGGGQEMWFPGSLDEVRAYDTVLTQTEIADLMVAPLPGDPKLFAPSACSRRPGECRARLPAASRELPAIDGQFVYGQQHGPYSAPGRARTRPHV